MIELQKGKARWNNRQLLGKYERKYKKVGK